MPNFTFVPHKGARPERSGLVKSHVMREAQRRRREARHKQARNTVETNEDVSSGSVSQDTVYNSSSGYLSPIGVHSFAAQEESVPEGNGIFYHALVTSHCANPEFPYFEPLGDDLPAHNVHEIAMMETALNTLAPPRIDTSVNPFNHPPDPNSDDAFITFHATTQYDSPSPTNEISWLYPSFFGQKQPSDPTWISETLFSRVMELVSHYAAALSADISTLSPTHPVSYWQRAALTNPKILINCALFYCAYRDVSRGFPGDDHHYLKGRVLHHINSAMEDPETAIAEENIASVVSQCMYENIRGSDVIKAHLKGLRQMIDLRGGINALPSDQGQCLGEHATLQDAIHACCSNVSPFMIDITEPVLREVRSLGPDKFYPQSPLRIVQDVGLFSPHTELRTSAEILTDAFEGFEMLCLEVFDAEKVVSDEQFFRLRREKCSSYLRLPNASTGNEIPSTAQEKVEEATRLAARIHFRAVALRIPHDDEVNVEDMARLHTVLRKIDMQYWKSAHYVYLWIVLTGGAASNGHPDQRPYFASEQMRLGLSIGFLDWRAFKQTLGNFLWLQQLLRKGKAGTSTEGL